MPKPPLRFGFVTPAGGVRGLNVNRKLQIKVLKNGPDPNSQEEIDCAAWLIKYGFAEGSVMPDHSRPGNHAYKVMWRGRTPKSDNRLAQLNLVTRFMASKVVTGVIVGVVVGVVLFFILRPFQASSQQQGQHNIQQQQSPKGTK